MLSLRILRIPKKLTKLQPFISMLCGSGQTFALALGHEFPLWARNQGWAPEAPRPYMSSPWPAGAGMGTRRQLLPGSF